MCGGSSETANEALRAFMKARVGRPLTKAERGEYRALLQQWNAANQHERLSRGDVVEVA